MRSVKATMQSEAVWPLIFASNIANLSRIIAVAAIIVMLVSVNFEVFARSLFNLATSWATEVSTYLIVTITFIASALTAKNDSNVRVDLLSGRLPNRLKSSLLLGEQWFAFFVSLIVLWKVSVFWLENLESGARSWSLLTTPLWIPQLAMPVGLSALCGALAGLGTRLRWVSTMGLALGVVAFALALGSDLVAVTFEPAQVVILFGFLSILLALIGGGMAAIGVTLAFVLVQGALLWITRDVGLAGKSFALVGILFLLLLSGLPVVFCLISVGLFAMLFWLPPVTLSVIGERSWDAVNTFELTAIPMFVLMGSILVRSNASSEMFAAARISLGRVRGGMALASIMASGIFAAVSGSSLATAATMGRVAGPEMIDEQYRPQLAYGVLAAGGTLGILIPPSIAMIIYGPFAGVPVSELFMAGLIPGLLMIGAFSIVVVIWSSLDPSAAPHGQPYSFGDKLRSLKGVVPFMVLMVLVLGSLYAGIATPTEAGAVGSLGALAISLMRGTFTIRGFLSACEEAAVTTSFLLMIAVGAAIMSFVLDFLAMPQALVGLVQSLQLNDLWLFVAIVLLYLLLGMFMEPISMILITLPIVLPVVAAAGWDPLWFGIVLVMLVEIGLITPPVGMILYVLAGVSEERASLTQISLGALPFVGAFLAMIFVFFAFPGVVTFLPELLR